MVVGLLVGVRVVVVRVVMVMVVWVWMELVRMGRVVW